MAIFKRKTWVNRVVEFANRYRMTDVDTGAVTEVNLRRDPGTVTEEGDAVSAATMNDLEDRIQDALDQNENEYNTHLETIRGYLTSAQRSEAAASDSAAQAASSASSASSDAAIASSSASVAQTESKAAGASMESAANSANTARGYANAAEASKTAAAECEQATKDAIATTGYAHLWLNDAGHLMLYRTAKAEEDLDFNIKDHKNLEVSLA